MVAVVAVLGAGALVPLNVVLWVWAAGVVREYRREAEELRLAGEIVRLHAENRRLRADGARKDDLLGVANRELDALGRQAALLKADMVRCGIVGGPPVGSN